MNKIDNVFFTSYLVEIESFCILMQYGIGAKGKLRHFINCISVCSYG